MEKMLNFTFDWIFFKLAGIQDRYKIWDEFELRPDPINFGVSRPWTPEKMFWTRLPLQFWSNLHLICKLWRLDKVSTIYMHSRHIVLNLLEVITPERQNNSFPAYPCHSVFTFNQKAQSHIGPKLEVWLGQKSMQVTCISSSRGQLPHCWKYLQEKTADFLCSSAVFTLRDWVRGEISN